MRLKVFSAAALALALLTAFTLVPATAARTQGSTHARQAVSSAVVSNPFHAIPVSGTSAKGRFTGTFDVTRFAVKRRHAYAVGVLNGTVKNASGNVVKTVKNQTVRIPLRTKKRAKTASVQATCQVLHLELGPVDLNLLGLMVHLNRVVLDITAQSGPGNLLGNLLCSVANLLNRPHPPLGLLVRQLNRLLSLSHLLQNIPLTGTTQNGTFTGTLDVQRLILQNGQLALVGVVNGVVKDAAGNVIATIVNAPVTIPLGNASGTCQVLHLELGPLDVNLLGLMVHLDKVVLDVTAQSGPGNLLGNLLCSIANALNQNALQQVIDLINGILPVRIVR